VAQTSILLFVDDDGRLDVRATARVLANMKESHYVAVAGRIVEPGTDTCDDCCRQPSLERSPPAPTVFFSGGIFAIRRDVFLSCCGYWADSARQGEELDLALKLFKNNKAIVYDPGLMLYHPQRHRVPSSSISIATSASGTRAFVSHFPIPIALAAYAWKLGRHIYWLVSNKEPGLAKLVSAVTTDARRGWSERDPMTYKQAAEFRRVVRRSANIAATRFSLRRAVAARLRRRSPPASS
jgi:GT2 family glycosyltransferase